MKYTDEELAELGIIRTAGVGRGTNGATVYLYKCGKCGRKVQKLSLILDRPIYCDTCKTNAKAKRIIADRRAQEDAKELESLLGIDHKAEDRYYKATKAVAKHGDYSKAIEAAKEYMSKYGSVPEAITAIILASIDAEFIPQYKIKRITVDFAIPSKKMVIEVDGALYHSDKFKEDRRDSEIKEAVGSDWTILHLPAESITKSPKVLKDALRKRLRSA